MLSYLSIDCLPPSVGVADPRWRRRINAELGSTRREEAEGDSVDLHYI